MEHKRGDSFDYVTTIPDTYPDGYFAGWTVAAQVRNPSSGALIANLEPSWADPATTRTLHLLKIDTSTWPVGKAEFDVQFTRASDGFKASTLTVEFAILKDVTKP